MDIYFCDHFVLPLPEGHRFPMQKYARLRQRLISSRLPSRPKLRVPPAATDAQLQLAHDPDYVRRVADGTLTRQEVRRIGFPWSQEMVERSRRSTGATLAGARAALKSGASVNLAGGTHHAGFDHGEGYCVFNDAAVTIRTLQDEGHVRRVVVMDCDVHQGNGTAAIFAHDPEVMTISLHGARNFPFRKQKSDLDVDLPDGTTDEDYLSALRPAMAAALHHRPELAIFVAGVDPFVGDALGRLALSKAGLLARDRIVLEGFWQAGVPVVTVMAGGYAPEVDTIVDLHFQTVCTALALGVAQPSRTMR
ncbi:MAG: histone deacetylase [Bradymonadia bacterium]